MQGRRDSAATGNKGFAALAVQRHHGGAAQQTAQLNHIPHLFAQGGDDADGGGLGIDHANGCLVGNDGGNGCGAGITGDGNHVQTHGANAGHGFQLIQHQVEEILYPAMEDFAIDIIVGKGPSANSIRLDLPKFTLVGATTRAGQLSAPLRDRFGVSLRLELYSPEELSRIVTRSATILGMEIDPQGAMEIASRSRGTPRIANRFLRRVRDFAQIMGDGTITKEAADLALRRLEVDKLGLDAIDRRMLTAIIRNYNGGPVGLETLAATIGEEAVTLEDVYEPYLMQLGFLTRTPRGRCVTPLAYEHLHIPYEGQMQLSL